MALFKILRGPSSELTKLPINDGWCYFTPDTGLFHIDYNGQRVPLNSKNALNASNATSATMTEGIIDQNTGEVIKLWYGSTAEYEAIPTKDESTIYILSDGESGSIDATDIAYDNSISKLFATDVQNAIDELNYNIENIPTPDVSGQIRIHNEDPNAHINIVLITPEDIDTICSVTTNINIATMDEGVF